VSWAPAKDYRAPDAGGVLLTLAIVVPLAWRRQRPDLVLLISATALLCYDAAGYRSGLAWLACYWAVLPLAAVLVRIRVEEAELASALGQEYRSYASRTRRLVPGLW
jgi:protein-S-isoprenylcysteine O-methyltransferase Ste14